MHVATYFQSLTTTQHRTASTAPNCSPNINSTKTHQRYSSDMCTIWSFYFREQRGDLGTYILQVYFSDNLLIQYLNKWYTM